MWPDRVSNPGPLTYESGALLTALHGPALGYIKKLLKSWMDGLQFYVLFDSISDISGCWDDDN